jgi:hypothetical protein
LCPSLYHGVVQFVKDNPLIYKRVKKDYKKIISRKEDFYYLKRILKEQEKIKREKARSVKD